MNQITEFLKKNVKRSDAAEIARRLPQFNYQKVWRHLSGVNPPDPAIVAEALALFRERKREEEKLIRQFQKLEEVES